MDPAHPDVAARARIELAAELADLTEYATGAVAALTDPEAVFRPGERAMIARHIRLTSLRILTAALRDERADGVPWEYLAAALGDRRGTDAVAAHYATTVTAWVTAAEQDRADVPALPGLTAWAGLHPSRIPADWRRARIWLADWLRARTGDRANS